MSLEFFPPAVLGALITGVVAAASALSGVAVNAWDARKRLRVQLEHDAAQKVIERKAAVRKDVYLTLAEEVVKASNYLGRIPNIDFAVGDPAEPLQGLLATSAKLQLVAEPATALQAQQLARLYSAAFARLVLKASPIHDAQSSIKVLSQHRDQLHAEIERILATMTQLNETGRAEKEVFNALGRNFDFKSKRRDELSEQIEQLWIHRQGLHATFCNDLMMETAALADAQIPILVALRNDIGVGGDVDAFMEQMKAERLHTESYLTSFMDEMNKKLAP